MGIILQKIKNLLKDLEGETPHIGATILNAQQNLKPSQLMDNKHWQF